MKDYPRYSNDEIRQIIDNWIHSERNRRIFYLRLIDGLTHEEIADALQIDVSTVKRNINKYEDDIFCHVTLK